MQRSFDGLSEQFIERCRVAKSLSQLTIQAYCQDMAEARCFWKGGPHVDELTSQSLLDYVRYLGDDRGLALATIKRRLACLRAFFRWCVKHGHVKTSPFEKADITIKLPRRLPKAICRNELRQAGKKIETDAKFLTRLSSGTQFRTNDPRLTTLLGFWIMVATGIRVSELSSVNIGDVSSNGEAIKIYGKGARERLVYLEHKKLRSLVSRYRQQRARESVSSSPFLVNIRSVRLTPQALRLRLKKIGHSINLSHPLTPHRLRHTAATQLLEHGMDIRFVQRLLGHSSISTTEIYTHVTDQSLKAALRRAKHVEGALGGYG